MEHVFVRIKTKAEELGLNTTDLRHGVSIFLGTEKFEITDVIETKAEILSVNREILDKLAAVFAYARIYQVRFYVSNDRLRMRKEVRPLDKQTYEELTGVKSKNSWHDLLHDLFSK
jgi:hypothetical protein